MKYPNIKLSTKFTGKELYKRSLKMGQVIKLNMRQNYQYELLKFNGISSYLLDNKDILLLNFNRDLHYIFKNMTQILLDVDVVDINSNIYYKHNEYFYLDYNTKIWNRQVVDNVILGVGFLDYFISILTADRLYIIMYTESNDITIIQVNDGIKMIDTYILNNHGEIFYLNYFINLLIQVDTEVVKLYLGGYKKKNNKIYKLSYVESDNISIERINQSSIHALHVVYDDVMLVKHDNEFTLRSPLIIDELIIPNIKNISGNHIEVFLISNDSY